MSFRSALNAPTPNSGNVGEAKTGVGANNVVVVPNGVLTPIDTITLGTGVWQVSLASELVIGAGCDVAVANFYLSSSSTYLKYSEVGGVTFANATTLNSSRSLVVTLTAPATLSYSTNTSFSTGTFSLAKPAITGNNYITATKLA
jgi:hypothetical protein